MKKTFVGVEKFSNEDLFSRVLASSSVYEMTKKKKKKKELFKSRTTLVQKERERERGKKITQHKAEKWISSRSFKFLFFFFSFKRIRDLLTFVHKEECIRQVYEVSNLSDLPFHGENEFLHCGKWRDKVKLWGWIFMKAEIRRIIGKFIK